MEDEAILALYWQRDEEALAATAAKYGGYCGSIARQILGDPGDAEECVNDTWLHAWNAIPPHRPPRLSLFLGKITRELAINRWNAGRAQKRGGGEYALALEELREVVSARSPRASATAREMSTLPPGALASSRAEVFTVSPMAV